MSYSEKGLAAHFQGLQASAWQPYQAEGFPILGNPLPPRPPSLDLTLTLVLRLQVYASSQPLRVGYYETDNYTMPTPAMKRAVVETKQRLEAAGHTVWLQEPKSPGMALSSWPPSLPGILAP